MASGFRNSACIRITRGPWKQIALVPRVPCLAGLRRDQRVCVLKRSQEMALPGTTPRNDSPKQMEQEGTLKMARNRNCAIND